jgi:hypothetical protein
MMKNCGQPETNRKNTRNVSAAVTTRRSRPGTPLTAAVAELPDDIRHLAIRPVSLAAGIGDTQLAKYVFSQIPQSRTWPSYLKHLVMQLRSIDP